MESIRSVFHARGLVYLSHSRIADPRVSEYDWGTSPYYHANREEFERLSERYGEALRRGIRPALVVKEAGPDLGWGLFAGTDLAVDDLVGEYAGVVQASGDAPPHELVDGHYLSDYAWNYPDELPDGTEFEVNALREGNELRFANHSHQANMAVDHTLVDGLFVTFFRMQIGVIAGTQLTVDYGEEYWTGGFRERKEL